MYKIKKKFVLSFYLDQNLGTQPKYIGCFQNKITFRNLEGDKIVLENSLTPNLCIDICKNRGFAFAGVEAGYKNKNVKFKLI